MTAAAALAVLLSGCGDGRPAADQPSADHVAADSGSVDTVMADSLPLPSADSDSLSSRDTTSRGTPIGDPAAVPRPGVRLPRPADSLSGERS
ncbi:MAG TPA: hypothetical protein VFO96_03815 [Gemmatimonadales bacterium]|nr:hypothetical protein [Gemmatimonadales bacterium]